MTPVVFAKEQLFEALVYKGKYTPPYNSKEFACCIWLTREGLLVLCSDRSFKLSIKGFGYLQDRVGIVATTRFKINAYIKSKKLVKDLML